jgi:hypothetical protein
VDTFIKPHQVFVVDSASPVKPDDAAHTSTAFRHIVFGGGATQIEQSYFGATRKGIRRFLSALHAIGHSDRKIAPEHKFMFAGTRLLPSPVLGLAVHTPIDRLRSAGVRLFSLICSLASGYEVLPFGYGRNRPINFDDEVFYFQHGSAAEISQYRTVAGFAMGQARG